jgi:hypothetical protein
VTVSLSRRDLLAERIGDAIEAVRNLQARR